MNYEYKIAGRKIIFCGIMLRNPRQRQNAAADNILGMASPAAFKTGVKSNSPSFGQSTKDRIMKKLTNILMLAFAAAAANAEFVVTENTTWTSAADNVKFEDNNLILTRESALDMNSLYIDVGTYAGDVLSMNPTELNNAFLSFTDCSVNGSGGSLTLNAADDGGDYYGKITLGGTISIQNATLNISQATDRSFATSSSTKIEVSSGGILNIDVAGASSGTSLSLGSGDKTGEINLTGSKASYYNIFFGSTNSSTVNGFAVNLLTSATSVTLNSDVAVSNYRATIDAKGKDITFNASKTVGYTVVGFKDYASITFTGDGLKNLNTVTFSTPSDSSATVSITGGTLIMQGNITSSANMNVSNTVGSVTFGSGANGTVLNLLSGKTLTIEAGTAIAMNTAYLQINYGNVILNRELVSTTNQDIRLSTGTSLTMNVDTSLGSRVLLKGTTATFGVGAAIALDNFYFESPSSSTLTLNFSDDASLDLQSFDNFTNGLVYINGEILNQFKIYEVDEADIDAYMARFTSSTGNVYFEKISDGVYWVNTLVPEPAEWAAIFGAIALGLSIYRKRGSRK